MSEFSEVNYWNERYKNGGNSGAGSYNEEAMLKASFINTWIKNLDIKTITEIGTGDGNNAMMYDVKMSYCGYDISSEAIKLSETRFNKHRNRLFYLFTDKEEYIDYDAKLCLCLDVWYHLINDSVFEELCQKLFVKGNWKYIIIYSFEANPFPNQKAGQHIKYRDVLSKVAEFPNWELTYWVSGYSDNHLPSKKKMFLFTRKDA